jgi:hypothetical protein
MAPTKATMATMPISEERHNGNGVNGNGTARSVTITVNGRVLDLSAIALMGPEELAVTAADLRRGGWSARAVQTLLRPNPAYTSTARHLTGAERQQVDDGTKSLSFFHNRKRNAKRLDREIEAFVARKARKDPAGVAEVLFRLVDHLTAPASVPAE